MSVRVQLSAGEIEALLTALNPNAFASAEARLREALDKLKNEAVGMLALGESAMRQSVGNTNVACLQQRIKEAEQALSAHPHASDCDKQGETTTKIKVPLPDWLGPDTPENRERLQAFVEGRKVPGPSDRAADVRAKVRSIVCGIYGVGRGDFGGGFQTKSIDKAVEKIIAVTSDAFIVGMR